MVVKDNKLITRYHDNVLKIWNLDKGTKMDSLYGTTHIIDKKDNDYSIYVSASGEVICKLDTILEIWNVDTRTYKYISSV